MDQVPSPGPVVTPPPAGNTIDAPVAVSSKMSFWLGFFSGLASISVVGFFVMLTLVFSGRESVNVAAQAQNPDNNAAADVQDTGDTQPSVPVRPISKDDHYRGDLNAKVQIVVYDDFECPFCLRHNDTVQQIIKEYGNKVVLAIRHFPLSFHENAQKAAEASECAAEQGKFWEMHDALFADQEAGNMGVAEFKKDAKEIGLKTAQFDSCLDSGKYAQKVVDEENEAVTFGVNGTPGNFVNGQLLSGALPYAQFKTMIDALLAQ